MSLSLWLSEKENRPKSTEEMVPVRERGTIKWYTKAEYREMHPDREPVAILNVDCGVLHDINITHNLTQMAEEAGIYKWMWRVDELGIKSAQELIVPLQMGLDRLLNDPEKYRQYNPENGWGTYEGLVAVVRDLIEACKKYPEAEVEISR